MKLPRGWVLTTTGTVCSSIVPGRDKPRSFSGNIAWVTLPDIVNRYVPSDKHILRLTPDEIQSVGTRIVPEGSVIMSCVGEFGIVAINIVPVVINQQLHAFVCSDSVVPAFLMYCLQSSLKQMQAFASTTTIPYLNKSNCESIPLLLPPRNEQEGITQLLFTWDTAIENMERLLGVKEKRFLWLVNRLIKKESVKGKWRRVKLGKVAEINKGQQLNVADMVDTGKYYALNGGIEPSGFTNNWNTLENTITISEGGNSCGFVSFNTQKFWCGGHCYALNNLISEVEKKYLYHFLKAHEQSLMSMRVGSGLPNIQKKDLQNFPVKFPSLFEQNIIAETLNTARQEIDLLKKQVEDYRKQKRGLMHKLLTGQWRVKIGEGER